MNFLSLNLLSIAVLILFIATIILLLVVYSMHRRLKNFLVDVNSRNIADSLEHVSGELKDLNIFRDEIEKYLTTVEKRLRKSVQSIHTLRFNPFKGTGGGGNQSFATTLLTEDGDGVIISSLYSRDHVSIFAKPVRKHSSEHELSEEEKESLEYAKKYL
jgi:hypothetical protein